MRCCNFESVGSDMQLVNLVRSVMSDEEGNRAVEWVLVRITRI